MDVITTVGALFGAVLGAAFLLAGGVLLPLWQLSDEHDTTAKQRKAAYRSAARSTAEHREAAA
ncbi:MAG: hypothetical protein ACRDXX_13655 [Stackebrandtia sp.]